MKNLPRDDISNYLIHFTKPADESAGKTEIKAIEVYVKILKAKCLLGGTGMIKGNYTCVCFTEAPVGKLPHMFSRREDYGIRYHPYGIMFSKKFLYDAGARPVIYSPEGDFDILPDSMKYRHVRYEPTKDFPIDHTWEREWRLHASRLEFKPADVTLIVPTRKNADTIRKKDPDWHSIALEDLGMTKE